VPWQLAAKRANARVRFVDVEEDGRLRLDQLDTLLSERTKLVVFPHVSNVLELDAMGIAVRGGDLASLPILKRMGVHEAIRASCYAYTSTEAIDRLITAL